jgi:hypothetical protein
LLNGNCCRRGTRSSTWDRFRRFASGGAFCWEILVCQAPTLKVLWGLGFQAAICWLRGSGVCSSARSTAHRGEQRTNHQQVGSPRSFVLLGRVDVWDTDLGLLPS